MTQTIDSMTAPSSNSSRASSWPITAARVLLVPLAFLTIVGAVVFDGLSAFGIVLLGGAAVYIATILLGGKSRSVQLAALGVLPLHFLFNVTKVAGGEVFSAVFLVLTGASIVLLGMSMRSATPSPR